MFWFTLNIFICVEREKSFPPALLWDVSQKEESLPFQQTFSDTDSEILFWKEVAVLKCHCIKLSALTCRRKECDWKLELLRYLRLKFCIKWTFNIHFITNRLSLMHYPIISVSKGSWNELRNGGVSGKCYICNTSCMCLAELSSAWEFYRIGEMENRST